MRGNIFYDHQVPFAYFPSTGNNGTPNMNCPFIEPRSNLRSIQIMMLRNSGRDDRWSQKLFPRTANYVYGSQNKFQIMSFNRFFWKIDKTVSEEYELTDPGRSRSDSVQIQEFHWNSRSFQGWSSSLRARLVTSSGIPESYRSSTFISEVFDADRSRDPILRCDTFSGNRENRP